MSLLTSIKLNIAERLEKDKDFRKTFFRGRAEDEIAISIRLLREKRKMRQIDLANESKMKQSAISRIEQADYCGWTLKTLFRVADALNARLRVIFEPTEQVIEYYKEKEKGDILDEQFASIHEAHAFKDKVQEEGLAISGTVISLPTITFNS